MTKAAHCRRLYSVHGERDLHKIAATVGCHVAYVRVACFQRQIGVSKAERHYREKKRLQRLAALADAQVAEDLAKV